MPILVYLSKKKIHRLLTGCFLLLSSLAYSQTSSKISGTVSDHEGNVLAGATVLLNGGDQKTATNEQGFYTFTNLANGTYIVRANFFGSFEERSTSISGQNSVVLDIKLSNQERQLDAVNISVNRKTIPSSTLRLSKNLLVTPQNIQIIDQNTLSDQMILSTAEGFTKNVSGARTVYHQEEGSAGIYVRGYSASNLRNGMEFTTRYTEISQQRIFRYMIEVNHCANVAPCT